ncbi:MAG: hypothetical protein HRU32_00715 [Rhodobacteraceae bacterium]|nr:hypothetical protein [Paracoccaceae bacterium]
MSVQVTIKALLQGIATDDVQQAQDAWRHLVQSGQAASAAIAFILEQGNWTVPGTEAHTRHLAVLLAVLHEIDPREARRQAARLVNLNIDPVHRATLEHMSARFAGTPDRVTGDGVELYLSPQINDRDTALEVADAWLATMPKPHLDTITRVTLVPERPEFAYLDGFAAMFSDVCLTWPMAKPGTLAQTIGMLLAERRFYGAAAHKIYAHDRGGPIARQRSEARRFAGRMMRRSHPTLGVIGTPLTAMGALMRPGPTGLRTN